MQVTSKCFFILTFFTVKKRERSFLNLDGCNWCNKKASFCPSFHFCVMFQNLFLRQMKVKYIALTRWKDHSMQLRWPAETILQLDFFHLSFWFRRDQHAGNKFMQSKPNEEIVLFSWMTPLEAAVPCTQKSRVSGRRWTLTFSPAMLGLCWVRAFRHAAPHLLHWNNKYWFCWL